MEKPCGPDIGTPTSAKEAISRGLPRYFNGIPCKNGHIDFRYANRTCVACHRSISRRFDLTRSGRAISRSKNRAYKAGLGLGTPKWSERDQIRSFYYSCPPGFHVDHILPLGNKDICCGLHVMANLQWLSIGENSAKGSKIDPATLENNVCVIPQYRSYPKLHRRHPISFNDNDALKLSETPTSQDPK